MANPEWVKGKSGNPAGRPKGSYAIHTQLEKAIEGVGKDKKIDIYKHFVERAYDNDTVLVALLRKLVPDRQYSEGDAERIINIVYAYREKSNDNTLRGGQGRLAKQISPNSTKDT